MLSGEPDGRLAADSVAARPLVRDGVKPDGSAMLLVSTRGLDDDALVAVKARRGADVPPT